MRRFLLVLLAGSLACLGLAQSGSLSRFNVEIQTVDDYDVTTGQSVSVDPNGFDVKVSVTHPGATIPHRDGQVYSESDLAELGSDLIRFQAVLPDGEQIPLTGDVEPSPAGSTYAHLRLAPEALSRFDAISNPEISVLATLAPRSGGAGAAVSRAVRLGLKISALRSGETVVPYTYRKVEELPLKPIFSAPVTLRADEAYLGGTAPKVPGNLPYYLWLCYTVGGSAESHFVPVAPPASGGWRADLGYLKPDTYRLVAFASPHADTSTFAADGWRADAYAISPEVTETIVPAGFHFSALWASILLALLFIAAAMLTLRNPESADAHSTAHDAEGQVKRPPSFTARAHRALAWVLLALATITIVNYYEFFTTIVASALRGDPIIGQDWNLQNSGGISLLIMSYSISLGLCVELGLYKLMTLWRERQAYGPVAYFLGAVWLGAVALAAWCAFAFIIHIGEFYNTQPALRELGHLAGAAELVIFFCAIGGLMPMEHETWAPSSAVAGGKAPWRERVMRVFRGPKPTETAVVMMEPKGVQEPTSVL